jgi:hypothetical protein
MLLKEVHTSLYSPDDVFIELNIFYEFILIEFFVKHIQVFGGRVFRG